MNLIALAGNSFKNKEWLQKVAHSMSFYFNNVRILEYLHWSTDNAIINFDSEAQRLRHFDFNGESYFLFAKSAGTLVALKAIQQGIIVPQKCVFVGFPASWAEENQIDYKSLLKKSSVPTLFIQHTDDPALSFMGLKSLLQNNGPKDFEIIELPGDTHDYLETERLAELTNNFCK